MENSFKIEPIDNYIKGQCMEMCPQEEIKMRQQSKLLHILEIVPGTETDSFPKADNKRTVKSFCRSAAGKLLQDKTLLRPPNVLLGTVRYLLDEVVSNTRVPWNVTYDFLMDRLRSVRQDMVIQNASRAHYISILQPIVRFYAYSSYRLCGENLNTFDPYINNTHLQECLKRLLVMYDDCDELYSKSENVEFYNEFLIKSRPQFEALYLVLNLGNTTAIRRTLNLLDIWRRKHLVKLALKLSLNFLNGNYIKFCRVMKLLPPLLMAVASLKLPELKRKTFQMMSVAYSSKNLNFPIEVLREHLLYDSNEQVKEDCKYYDITYTENGIRFLKTVFNENAPARGPCHLNIVDKRLAEVELPMLLLFGD